MRVIKKIIFLFLLLMIASIMSIIFLAIFTGGLFLISKAAEVSRVDWCFLLTLFMIAVLICIKYAFDRLFVHSCQKTERGG